MNENDMQHGIDYDGQDIIGWIATEKYNGCRAYWDGENLWSRGGLQINIPDSWRSALPAGVHLDGEIYDGVDGVYRCGTAIKYGRFTPSMKFMVFDCPTAYGDYLSRLNYARQFDEGISEVVNAWFVMDMPFIQRLLSEIQEQGGEGLVLRHPDLKYAPERTVQILKLKGMNS